MSMRGVTGRYGDTSPPFDSYSTREQKVATLIATLKKVEFMAGDEVQRGKSAVLKLKEFQELGYPRQVRQSACFRLGRETGRCVWFAVGAMQG